MKQFIVWVCEAINQALTCRALAANLKTFSLSTSMISWETETTTEGGGGTWSGCRERGSYGQHRSASLLPYNNLDLFSKWTRVFFSFSSDCRLCIPSQQSEKTVPCSHCLPSRGAPRVHRQWIIRELLGERREEKKKKTTRQNRLSLFQPSRKTQEKHTYVVDSGFCIQEEQLHCNDVLELCDIFYIKPIRGMKADAAVLRVKLRVSGWQFNMDVLSRRYDFKDNTKQECCITELPRASCWQPRCGAPWWRKKWTITWPGSLGRWARTSSKSHAREPCGPSATTYADHCQGGKKTKKDQCIRKAVFRHVRTSMNIQNTWQFTYLSSQNASPKNSFSLRLKWEETKSRSSYDRSLGCGRKIDVQLESLL